jgi:hypothetical protein
MPFVLGVLFGMNLVKSQETQVVYHQEHPCFEGHTKVGIVLEAMAVAPQDFALCDDDGVATGDALRSGHPVWHAPCELTRDSCSMSSGTSLLGGSHCGMNPSVDNGGGRRFAVHDDDDNATGDALRLGILFGMHLVNLQENQVVCR